MSAGDTDLIKAKVDERLSRRMPTRRHHIVDRRLRIARRVAACSAIATIPAIGSTLLTGNRALLIMSLLLMVVSILVPLVALGHPFLLLPREYFSWLRRMPPYVATTFVGQAGERLIQLLGASGALVVGAVVGADLGAAERGSSVTLTIEYVISIAVTGVLFWWLTGTIFRLGVMHRRALRSGELIRLPGSPGSAWMLCIVLWFAVVLGAVSVTALLPDVVRWVSSVLGLR